MKIHIPKGIKCVYLVGEYELLFAHKSRLYIDEKRKSSILCKNQKDKTNPKYYIKEIDLYEIRLLSE